ncbi:MAG: DUF2971 domain-containing protein [Peptococcaceae bacterium]|nr:DUF2971 domain-containing protein [Peptococcaceae bacterium]
MMQEYEKILNQKYEEVYNELEKEVHSDLPFRIYHYTGASFLQSIIKHKLGEKAKLWFTKWNFLNDFSELRYIHEVVDNNLHILNDKTPELYKFLKEINGIDRALKNDTTFLRYSARENYILSFSLEPDLLNMWTYYTKSAQNDGYSIGFDTSELVRSINNANHITVQCGYVIYDEKEQERIIQKMLSELQEMYIMLMDNSDEIKYIRWMISNCFEDYINLLACYFKHPAFKEEKEIRLVYENVQNTMWEKVREKNGLFIPYVELDYDVESIEEVWISPTLQDKHAAYGLNILGEQYGINWSINQSKIPFRNI